MPFHSIKLNDGRLCPPIAFGSAKSPKDDLGCAEQVDQAIEVGFDHIDTAQMYLNESGVGLALKQSALPRSSTWITTKWSGSDGKGVKQSCKESLEKLGIEYIDLYLIHNPRICGNDIEGRWKEMEELKKEGKVKSIGVSNFNIEQLERVLKICTTPPTVNQIFYNPYVYKSSIPLLEYMKQRNIIPEAYSGLNSITRKPGGPVDKPVEEIAASTIIVTTSSRKDRLESYLAVGDITLTSDDIAKIDKAGAKGEAQDAIRARAGVIAKYTAAGIMGAYSLWKYVV